MGLAVAAVTLLAAAPAGAASPRLPGHLRATLPAPAVHADPADTDGALDVRSASFGQVDHRFRLRVELGAVLPLAGLAAGDPARFICVDVQQPPPGRAQRICLHVSPAHRLGLVSMRRRTNATYGSPTRLPAVVRRVGGRGFAAVFLPADAHLAHGRLAWRLHTSWHDQPDCDARPCVDDLPDRAGVPARVHRAYVTGCTPAGPSLRRAGPTGHRQVALTFDDGPGPQTPDVLRFLARQHIHATFFELGIQAVLFPDFVRRTLDEGHVIGDHTYDHKAITSLSAGAQVSELVRARHAISRATGGYRPCLFRPPQGVIDRAAARRARDLGMLSILWSVDPRDWARPGTDAIVERVLAGVGPGGIVLMHDAGGPRGQTIAALPRIVAALRSRHYTFVTVPELLRLHATFAWD
jgi:peptidoglycan/xylan/chitin deacetylase (PgdA/CDA1 family)